MIHGRKDEDILGSAYVKKYRRMTRLIGPVMPIIPRGMLNRRRLTRGKTTQFTVENVVGDPGKRLPRNFDALFEESDNRLTKPKTTSLPAEAFNLA